MPRPASGSGSKRFVDKGNVTLPSHHTGIRNFICISRTKKRCVRSFALPVRYDAVIWVAHKIAHFLCMWGCARFATSEICSFGLSPHLNEQSVTVHHGASLGRQFSNSAMLLICQRETSSFTSCHACRYSRRLTCARFHRFRPLGIRHARSGMIPV